MVKLIGLWGFGWLAPAKPSYQIYRNLRPFAGPSRFSFCAAVCPLLPSPFLGFPLTLRHSEYNTTRQFTIRHNEVRHVDRHLFFSMVTLIHKKRSPVCYSGAALAAASPGIESYSLSEDKSHQNIKVDSHYWLSL